MFCNGISTCSSIRIYSQVCCFRCREKQRKESSQLQTVNRKLTSMNKLLLEENTRLQKQVTQLIYDNSYLRQRTQNVSFCCSFPRIIVVLLFGSELWSLNAAGCISDNACIL